MATILSQYSTTGFYNAPVSKGLMGYMFLSCTALNVPLFAHLKKYLRCRITEDLFNGEIWRVVTSKLAFVDTKDLVCGSLLIYYFRVFERRFGSHKFASNLVATQVLSIFFELITVTLLQYFNLDVYKDGILPPGPYGIIFPLFVNYFFDIPRVAQTNILGIPISGKTLTYLLGLQVCWPSYDTLISAMCGIAAGLVYKFNFLNIQKLPWVPMWMSRAAEATIKKFVTSSSPVLEPIGATVELQRVQEMEMLEQQMILNRAREFRNRGVNNGVPPYLANFIPTGENNADVDIQPSEENIQLLLEMGFERQRIISALTSTHNNVTDATAILLQDS